MAQFASDTFTGVNTTLLQDYSANWVKHSSATSNAQITTTNTVRLSTTNQTALYYNTGAPASADYEVSCDLVNVTNRSHSCGVCGRMDTSANTFYYARLFQSATVGEYKLFKFVAGTLTQLGSTVNFNTSAGITYSVKLKMVGDTIELYKQGEGTASVSATDSAITAAGKAGIRLNSTDTASNTTGMHIDNFSADDVAGGAVAHDTSGALAGAGAELVAAAARMRAHAASGVLAAAGASVSGTSAHIALHGTSGALVGGAAAISGSADHAAAAGGEHATSGALAGAGAVLDASAARTRVHAASGALAGQGADVDGTAAIAIEHIASGALVGDGAVITGSAAAPAPISEDVTPGPLRTPGRRRERHAALEQQPDPYRDIDWSLVQRRLEQSIARDRQRTQNMQKLMLLMAA